MGAAIAIATCAEVPDLDPEGRLLLEALTEAGLEPAAAIWDDPALDWNDFDRVLLRSTWDYPAKAQAFESWLRSIDQRLINPLPAVEWNLSKRYLEALRAWGFPIVPSSFLTPGDEPALPFAGEIVVKPAISAGSRDTARYGEREAARALEHASDLLESGREVLLQPYLPSVDVEAETAVIVLGGEVSHAMRKGPLLAPGQGLERGLFRQEQMEPRRANAQERELATEVVGRFAQEVCAPVYARVDLLRSESGEPLVLELELIEPSLFLDHHPPAVERLVALLAG